jgi:YegS/Rv2252/BmrU family lipid kinase
MIYAVIVNPNAGKKKGQQTADILTAALRKRNLQYELFVSHRPGQTIDHAISLDTSRYEGILAVGGDGTLFEVINGLMRGNGELTLPIGLIPVGTGNSFIKDLNITTLEEAFQAVFSGRTKSVDVGEFTYGENSWFFANLLGIGFVSNVAYRARKYKLLGAMSYIFGVLEEVAVLKASNIELTIDGRKYKREAVFVEVCNSRYTGGNMKMAPDALIDDGFLDVVLMNKSSRMELIRLFPSIFKGRHINDDKLEVFRGREVSIRSNSPLPLTPDGETFGETPIDIRIHPGKLTMYC